MTARLRVVFDAEAALYSATEMPMIAKEKIQINNICISHFSEIAEILLGRKNGRFTIRGGNGSGKTTLLQWIKIKMGDQAMLIPSDQGELVWNADTKNLSSGQAALLRIHEAASHEEIVYVLLDEWDANLDKKNTNDVDLLLNDLSQTKVVIEVRH